MKKNICLIYFDHMSGEFTSILDVYSGLFRNKRRDFELEIVAEPNHSEILRLYESLPRHYDIKINLGQLDKKEYGTVICSAFYFFNIARGKIKNFFECEKLIILDSSSFIMGDLNNVNIFDTIEKFPASNRYILGNNFNSSFFGRDYYHYYHKLDFERITEFQDRGKSGTFTKKGLKHPLTYETYDYYRRVNISFDPLKKIYFENIGKSIFEFLYLKRPVSYKIKNKCYPEDGLTDYLSIFGVADSVNQNLRIPSEEIEKKLGFHRDDLIMEIL